MGFIIFQERGGGQQQRAPHWVLVLGQGSASAQRALPKERMYMTAKPGLTTLVMAENHNETNSSGLQVVCSTKHDVIMSRRTHPKHDTAPGSPYNRHRITFR